MSAQIRCGITATSLAIAIILSFPAGPAAAQLPAAEFRCPNTVAKQGRKLFRKTFKAMAKCEDQITKGDLPVSTDCASDVEVAAKISDAEASYQEKLTKFCPDGVVANLDFGGSCSGVTTLAALTSCATDEHEDAAAALLALLFPRNICAGGFRSGSPCSVNTDCPTTDTMINGTCTPVNQGTDSDQQKCQRLLAKTVAKEAAKRMGTLQKC